MYAHLEIPNEPPLLQTSRLLAAQPAGKLITTYHTAVDRKVIPLDAMAPQFQQAVIAAEDKDFYNEGGINPLSIIRAAWANLTNGSIVEGGSTITQQYVKNVYTGSEQTYARKIEEAMLAVKLDRQLDKPQILEKYLNTIYYGHGAYGVEAAAQTYFNSHASQLTLSQSAALAGAIAAPSRYDLITHPNGARSRRDYVLDRMVIEGYITAEEAAAARAKPIHTVRPRVTNFEGAYFADYTRRILEDDFGTKAVTGDGLRIQSTLNLDWQRSAEQAVQNHLGDSSRAPEAAIVAIDPRNGEIKVMVGGRDFTESQVNLATGQGGSGRQAGSAFKVFTLAAAMKDGYSLDSYWVGPETITVNDPKCAGRGGKPWIVSNAGDGEAGTFSLASATADSVNTVFAQLVTQVKPEAVVRVAERMGITSPLQPHCSITLGAQAVNPLEMTVAYATLANEGDYYEPTPFTRITTPEQTRLKVSQRTREALDPNDANLVTNALEGVVTSGTGIAASLSPRPVAGKTGTAQNYADAWFCGYTPQLAACVWVGYPDEEKPLTDIQNGSSTVATVYGGTIPAEIWHDFMSDALEGQRTVGFTEPDFSTQTVGNQAPPSPEPEPEPTEEPTRPRPEPSPSDRPRPNPRPSPSPS